ncbi:DUF6077 domain-containing protein [Micromonospora sp. WMMD1082]|uniref:DUF6077 domain-containing protein n=1 Tax=Micromonospora sp. WMMD1082 TaxID=3016104 RepID=UPI00241611F6|nr:DUF6077 domain-containing protein [Micromonospora sp. WMMD1082]MDG4798734.1 DUF6077 domain-containing protein [Micromonospora sp. WMMD1082]
MTDETVDVAAPPPAAAGEATDPAPGVARRVRAVPLRVGAGIAAIPAVLTDGAVLAFALWTLLYHAALPLGLAPSLTLRIWLVAGPALALLTVLIRLTLRWRRRGSTAQVPASGPDDRAGMTAGAVRDPGVGPAAGEAGETEPATGPDRPARQATTDDVVPVPADGLASVPADEPAPAWADGSEPAPADGPAPNTAGRAGRMPAVQRWCTALVLLVGAGAAITAGLAGTPAGDGLSWWVPASAGAVAAVGAVLLTWRTWRVSPPTRPPAPTAWQSGYALLIAGVAAVASLYLARSTPDDIYYVGRSVWVAERDTVPLNDFLFSENVLPAMASQPPIASIEVLAGALARFLGLPAASATWYVLLPIMAVLAVLALWRLVQRWAPRRPVLAFTVAVAFLALVCGPDAALGTFHLPRLYQGKGMFVSAVVPLMWLYLTRWFDDRSRRGLVLIVALSITAIGLTTTAAIILPLLVGGAALMMLLVGRWKSALAAGVAALAYPVGAVVVTQLLLGSASEAAADVNVHSAAQTYQRTFEIGIVGVIGGLALWFGPLLARRRTPALLAAGGALVLSVLLLPGVLEWLGALTGISVVLWRVPWLLALPALIGLLCTVWLPTRLRSVRAVVGLVLAGAMVASFAIYATPMWSERSWVQVHGEPAWKVPPQRLGIAEWIRTLDRPDGLVLAPATVMRATPVITSWVRVVLPRDFYLIEYDINSQFSQDRLLLTRFADGGPTEGRPTRDQVAGALERLDVGTICVYSGNRFARRTAARLGYTEFAERPAPVSGQPGAVTCLRRT